MNKERNAWLEKFEPFITQSSKNYVAEMLADFDVQAVKEATNLTI